MWPSLERLGDWLLDLRKLPRAAVLAAVLVGSISPRVAVCTNEKQWEGFPVPPSEKPVLIERFQYNMRGSVRLLFFWIGKSGVGGGWISRIRTSGELSGAWFDGWEVLFGSNPEAVPGSHNRWGYARELAFWGSPEGSSSRPVLEKTTFEGFMTRSGEESLTDVREREGVASGGTAFEGTESLVFRDRASVEIRRFVTESDVSYEAPAEIGQLYLELLQSQNPDEKRTLSLRSPADRPYGFLTAVDSFLHDAVQIGNDKARWEELKRQVRQYSYNARHYSLELKKIKHHDEVEFEDELSLDDVLEIDFEARRTGAGNGHDFSVWTSCSGPLAGIPIKIVDKPRWWLKVELTLKDLQPAKTVIGPAAR
ncbi:MAG: hypothetical protein JSU96_20205 [Acidobacteriota bacterium]|nr:MAG: hypothetical protein JSU96_20205 [Acidobacteriota bacterium]